MDIVLRNVKKKDLAVIKSLAKALGFEVDKTDKPYNPEFVKEILAAAKEVENGGGKEISLDELRKMCGI
jgi:hypothetical protein